MTTGKTITRNSDTKTNEGRLKHVGKNGASAAATQTTKQRTVAVAPQRNVSSAINQDT